jgi:CAAX protease family protein
MSESLAVGPGTEREYVTLGRRLLAALIDNSVWFFFYVFLYGGVVAAVADQSTAAAGLLVFAYLTLWFNYFAFCEWRWGQTIGKNATGIMVASLDGTGISFGQASMRNLLRLVDWLVIGWVMIASNARKQRLGDEVAKTVVVRRPAHTGSTMQRAPELAARQIAGGSGDAAAAEPIPPARASADAPPDREAPEARPGIRGRLPEISWSLKRTIWGLVLGLIAALFAPLLVLPFDTSLKSDGAMLAAQGLFGLCLLAVPFGIASGWKPAGLGVARARLGLRRFAPSGIGWILLALFAYYVFAAIFASLVVTPDQEDIGGELGVGNQNVIVAVVAVVLIVGLAPLSEEVFFRGFFFSGLRSRLSLWPAALICGLVFGMVHAPTGITTVIPLGGLGVALAWLYDRTGSLWPCVLAHAFNNALALALLS